MATARVIYTVDFKFVDCCTKEKLEENWNTDDHSIVGLVFHEIPDSLDFIEQLIFEVEKVRYQVDPMPISIREVLIYLAQEWYEKHKGNLKSLAGEDPWWFGVATSWSTSSSAITLPRVKPPKDKRNRLHLQFA